RGVAQASAGPSARRPEDYGRGAEGLAEGRAEHQEGLASPLARHVPPSPPRSGSQLRNRLHQGRCGSGDRPRQGQAPGRAGQRGGVRYSQKRSSTCRHAGPERRGSEVREGVGRPGRKDPRLMLSAVTDAVLARIREHAGLLVFDGSPPNLTDPPYVVVWPSYDTENIDRLTMEQTNAV